MTNATITVTRNSLVYECGIYRWTWFCWRGATRKAAFRALNKRLNRIGDSNR